MKRYNSALSLLVFGFTLACTSISAHPHYEVAKVGYSLPETSNFNTSLSKDVDLTTIVGRGPIKKIVLDAGHGGKDQGCSGKHSKEKDVALDITLRVGQLIKKNHPDVQVIYTRDRDEFIPLHERADIANKNQADLFISIHCNTTAKRNSAMGTETFVMGLHRAEDNLDVAKRENSVITHEENYEAFYGGYDPNSDEGHITLSMYQNAFLDQSIALANMVENEFESHGQRVSRGVKQAGFLVLRNTVMPSILIEAGFLNHSKEEGFLTSDDGKGNIAQAIFNAFDQYKKEQDELFTSSSNKEIEAIPADQHETVIHQEVATNASTVVEKEEPVNYVERAKREIEKMKQKQSGQTEEAKPVATSSTASIIKPVDTPDNNTTVSSNTQPDTNREVISSSSSQPAESGKIVPREKTLEYVVQVSASSTKFRRGGGKWDEVKEDVLIRNENNMYKYQVGNLSDYQHALKRKDELKKIGFEDCFIVAYYNDNQIAVKEALRMGL